MATGLEIGKVCFEVLVNTLAHDNNGESKTTNIEYWHIVCICTTQYSVSQYRLAISKMINCKVVCKSYVLTGFLGFFAIMAFCLQKTIFLIYMYVC